MFNVIQCSKSKHYPISKLSQFQFSIQTEIGSLRGFFRYGALYVYTVGRKLSTRFRISHLRRHHLEELFWHHLKRRSLMASSAAFYLVIIGGFPRWRRFLAFCHFFARCRPRRTHAVFRLFS